MVRMKRTMRDRSYDRLYTKAPMSNLALQIPP
jgi:hypothetical protein